MFLLSAQIRHVLAMFQEAVFLQLLSMELSSPYADCRKTHCTQKKGKAVINQVPELKSFPQVTHTSQAGANSHFLFSGSMQDEMKQKKRKRDCSVTLLSVHRALSLLLPSTKKASNKTTVTTAVLCKPAVISFPSGLDLLYQK